MTFKGRGGKFKQRAPASVDIPFKRVVKEVVMADGEVVTHPVKVYQSPVPDMDHECHSSYMEHPFSTMDGCFTSRRAK